ncbi:MAG: UdgX family uracil-DNA binding protein [Pseudomonadales bacterium]
MNGGQPSLFAGGASNDTQAPLVKDTPQAVVVRFLPEFSEWQIAARRLLDQHCAPENAWWEPDPQTQPQQVASEQRPSYRIPRSFLPLARTASFNRAADRWSLLYRVLWRLAHDERELLSIAGDADVVRLNRYAAAVRRDAHKMKAFVRFRETPEPGFEQPRFVAWFEPDHYPLGYVAGFFKRRFFSMRWSILTPDACLHWDGSGEPWLTPGTTRDAGPGSDDWESAWQVYYASIFNPARVKVQAMQSEMPQKYWKNLPEAQLIPELLRASDQRVEAMTRAPKTNDELQCGPTPQPPSVALAQAASDPQRPALERLRDQAKACQRCPLAQCATQTVFGRGPAAANIMIIGEQPGDQEDLRGEPFVGPAGAVLQTALSQAGLDVASVYVTNTVKHFKHRVQGRRRIHERPNAREVFACSDWLAAEIALVQPRVIVCLGATAAQARLGASISLSRQRGRLLTANNQRYVLSWHPAYILRTQQAGLKARLAEQLASDLSLALAAANG